MGCCDSKPGKKLVKVDGGFRFKADFENRPGQGLACLEDRIVGAQAEVRVAFLVQGGAGTLTLTVSGPLHYALVHCKERALFLEVNCGTIEYGERVLMANLVAPVKDWRQKWILDFGEKTLSPVENREMVLGCDGPGKDITLVSRHDSQRRLTFSALDAGEAEEEEAPEEPEGPECGEQQPEQGGEAPPPPEGEYAGGWE
eukprot:CAMPEP_0197881334 /NCGR_PEP_ID=MMETSP1439-20131203/8857_1 /TAXON_ID=66791 /ORGANISM="Gonyaulax spinifera, Strain CCMP409" /LENGTH=199 /DNA_ID=CAMNT_0043500939 /DNA_START=64 /DNA_END=663 /DNA_ORIENTATION=-